MFSGRLDVGIKLKVFFATLVEDFWQIPSGHAIDRWWPH